MKKYNVKSVDVISGLVVLTIYGNGEDLKNNVKLSDENNNIFVINSVAMPGGKKTLNDETMLSVNWINENSQIGKTLSVVS